MPLLPGATPVAGGGSGEAHARQLLGQQRQKRRRPDSAPAKGWREPGCNVLRVSYPEQNYRATPHAQPRKFSGLARDQHRAGKHFEAGGLTAVAPHDEYASPHPAAGQTTDRAADGDAAAGHSSPLTRKGGCRVVARIAANLDTAAGHAAGQPVTGISADNQAASGHALTRMPADIAMNHHLTPAQPCAEMVHPREVAVTVQHPISCAAAYAEAVGQAGWPTIAADWELINFAA